MLNLSILLAYSLTNMERAAVELARYGNITSDQRMTCQGTVTRLTTYDYLGYKWTVCKVNGTVERVDKRVN